MYRSENYQAHRGERQEKRVSDALLAGPQTTDELAATLCLSRASIGIYIRRLRAASRVYVEGFNRAKSNAGRYSPRWALGSLPDAIEPRQKTMSEKFKLLKKDRERHELHLMKRRANAMVKRATATPHSWASALGL